MKVLVTGAAGFIGSHLCERLLARGDRVVGLDNFDPFYPRTMKLKNLAAALAHPAFKLVEGDVRNTADIQKALASGEGAPDVVVHLAALAGVRPSLLEPERFHDVNVMGSVRLFEACRAAGIARVVFASSSSVYGQDSAVPFKEQDPCGRPLSPYAASKRAGELIAWNAHHLYGPAMSCLRFFTVFGPRQRPDLAIHKFVSAMSRGEPIELYGDGSTARDYTYIDDIIDGVVAAIDRQVGQATGAADFRIYNLGGSRVTSLARLVELIAAELKVSPRIVWKPEQPGDMRHTLADVSLSQRELGYAPKVGLEEGIARFHKWWRTRDSLVTPGT
jgi:UDP-glucuronate 4-epimerase